MARIVLSHKKASYCIEFFSDAGQLDFVWESGDRSGLLTSGYSLEELKGLGWEVVKPKQMVNK